ncbi:ComEC/Rec2 family competence protein [Paenibacillus puldeungensis]|uniref:ComEC/Rec2 family competence protein n=1 Tax=Paenibacillus puldeungensis TaxID=696536 RepID=A0ABW3RZX9_9BACL
MRRLLRRPLTGIVCCWIAGSALAHLIDASRFWLLWSGILLLCPAICIFGRWPWRKLGVLLLAFTVGAVYWMYNESRNVSQISEGLSALESSGKGTEQDKLDGLSVRTIGTIVSDVEIDGDRVDFTVKLSQITRLGGEKVDQSNKANQQNQEGEGNIPGGEKARVQLRLAAPEQLKAAATWRRGQEISLTGSLERPQTARNFGGFDYRKYLHYQRIHWLIKSAGSEAVTVLPGKWGASRFLGTVDTLRVSLGERLERLFPDWQAGYMKGLIIGLQDELEPAKYAQFTQLGLTHILAISGSHVAINVGIIFGLLRLLRVSRETALLVVLIFVPAYVLLTGFSPSVIRSGIMTMLGIYLLRRGLMKDSINVLSAAALLMLLWEPYFLLNVSFQLSFAVTAGLIIFVPLIRPYFNGLPAKVSGTLAITLAAQIVSFPLTIYYFNQFSLLSLLANLLLVPVIGGIALPLGTAALLLSFLAFPLGMWVAVPVKLLNSATFWTTEWLGSRSGFMTYWKSPSLLWIALFYGFCFILLYLGARRAKLHVGGQEAIDDETAPLSRLHGQREEKRNQRPPSVKVYRIRGTYSLSQWITVHQRVLLRSAVAISLTMMLWFGYAPENDKGAVGHLQFIDVGQGDCTLITTPSGANILVDGGGTVSFGKPSDAWRKRRDPYEVGAKTVVPLLKKRGIHRLDAMILTHGDQDHIGGLQAVLEQFPVDAVLINGSLAESKTMEKIMNTALNRHIPIYSAYRGMVLKPDERTRLDFLYPLPQDKKTASLPYAEDQNPRSIVFRLEMNEAAFLFVGDLDEASEEEVLKLEKTEQRVDVLKVAHHGSKTSTTEDWLSYWKPAVGVISVGATNRYGHPHESVLTRLQKRGMAVFRTDQQGEIQIEVQNGFMKVRYKEP